MGTRYKTTLVGGLIWVLYGDTLLLAVDRILSAERTTLLGRDKEDITRITVSPYVKEDEKVFYVKETPDEIYKLIRKSMKELNVI